MKVWTRIQRRATPTCAALAAWLSLSPAEGAAEAGPGDELRAEGSVSAARPRVVLARTWVDSLQKSFELTITFSESVTGFTLSDIQATNASATSALSGSGSRYTVTMATTTNFEGVVTVTVPASAAINSSSEGNLARTLSFSADTKAPTVLKADVDGRELTVTFSEDLSEANTPAVGRFGVQVTRAGTNSEIDVSSVSISRDDVALTLEEAVLFGDVVALTYGDTGANALTDLAGNQATAINGFSVRNRTARTTGLVPSAPRSVRAEADGSTVIEVNWKVPASTGGDSIEGYVVQASTTGRAPWTTLVRDTRSAATRYRHTGLTAGTTRHYRVAAINANGTGPYSTVVQGTTAQAYPGPPRSLTARAAGTSSIELSWTAATAGSGGAITGYRIEVSTSATGNWRIVEDDTRTRQTKYTHTGLGPGVKRHYRVFAINRAGRSDASNVAHATTEATTPGAPVALRVVPSGVGGSRELLIAWSAPSSDGGSRITGYRIETSASGFGGWTVLVGRTDGAVTTYTHSGLAPGSTRYYRVAAVNAEGRGPYTSAVEGSTRAAPPSAPGRVRASADGPNSITLSWNAPLDDGGQPVTGYRIRHRTAVGSWIVVAANTGSTATTYSHQGLRPVTTYFYQVAGVNGAGVGPWSGEASTKTSPSVPGSPRSLSARAVGTSEIALSWSPPRDDGGAAVLGYRIEMSANGGRTWRMLRTNTGTRRTAFSDGNLNPATTRHYRVSAINQRGVGAPSNVASATTAATVPGAPRSLTATADGTARIDLSWTAPANDGGAEVEGYRIEARDDGGAWESLVAHTRSAATSHSETGLDPATTRHYRVSAINRVGVGKASSPASATTDATVPDPPTGLVATATSPTRIDLTWTAPAYDGGADVEGYKVEASESGANWSVLVANTGSAAATYAHTGLVPGSQRFYRVSAVNRAGAGKPSGVASAMTDDPVQRAGRLNATVLPHVAATMTSSTVSAIGDRIDAVASGAGALRRVDAGVFRGLAAGADGRFANDGSAHSLARLLGASSFQTPLEGGPGGPQEEPRGRRIATWGAGDYHDLGQPAAAELEWSGSVVSGHVGADARVAARVLAGVAASHSRANVDFADKTGAASVSGTYRTAMTSVNPYVAWLPDDFGTVLWTTGGMGWGDVHVDDGRAGLRSSPAQLTTGAVGAAYQISNRGLVGLRLRAEGWAGRLRVDGSEAAMDSLTLGLRRARLALEWTQGFRFAETNEVTIQLEGGVRYDDGDGANGAGMEVGGGVTYRNRAAGLTAEGKGRLLLSDLAGYEEWGVGGRIQLEPGSNGEGLSIRLTPSYGDAAGGVEDLWDRGVTSALGAPGARARGNLDGEVGWGLAGRRGAPFGGFRLGGGARAVSAGVKYELNPDAGVRFEATRRESGFGPARHAVGIRGRLKLR